MKPINLPTAAGIDFPLIHYLDLIGQAPAPAPSYRAGVRWLDAVSDLYSGAAAVRAGDLSPLAWGRSWLSARSFAVFAIDDLRPFLKEYRYGRRLLQPPLRALRAWG